MSAAEVLRALFGRGTRVEFDQPLWQQVTADAPLLDGLDDDERARLGALAADFLRRKEVQAVAGDALPTRTLYALAAQAVLPVLNLGLDWYRDWQTVVVYPADFVARHEYVDEDGVVHESERALSGEAWPDGPVILSRDGIEEGLAGEFADNLVIHEMAHKLDMSNGVVNGMPALHVDMPHDEWTAALSGAYQDFTRRVARRRETPFDDYAAEDPGEFFAVASESFFVEPEVLADWYPDVYAQFRAFYRQDPLARRRGHPARG